MLYCHVKINKTHSDKIHQDYVKKIKYKLCVKFLIQYQSSRRSAAIFLISFSIW